MALASAVLKRSKEDADPLPASQLWEAGPVLVVVLRRPGCLLCREQAIKIWNSKDKFDAAGVRLVLVVHEWIDREIKAFAPDYWGGELYFDEAKEFYKACHGGAIRRGSLLSLLSPSVWRNGRRAKDSGLVKDSNMKGDGLTMGGLLVLNKGGNVVYSYGEKEFGDHAPLEDVLAAAQKAGSS